MMMKKKNAPAVIWITTLALLLSTCASFTFNQRTAAQSANRFPAQREVVTDKNFPLLSRYATDLSLLALRGKLETPRGHEADIARVIESLSTSGKTPVVVGESDLDRDAIACGVAMEIAFGDVPATLRNRRVFRLSLDALAKARQPVTNSQAECRRSLPKPNRPKAESFSLSINLINMRARAPRWSRHLR